MENNESVNSKPIGNKQKVEPEASVQETDELILSELRLEFDREMDRRKIIENKASNLITLCSSIIAFLFAFTALSQRFFQDTIFTPLVPSIAIISLIIPGVILIVLSLFSSLRAIMIGKNLPAILPIDGLVYRDGTVGTQDLDAWRKYSLDHFCFSLERRYMEALAKHDDTNEIKLKRTRLSQKLLFVGIALVSVSLILTYVNLLK